MKTRAAILETLCAPLVLDEIEVPSLECGQVLVEVAPAASAAHNSGKSTVRRAPDKYLPHLLGHEGGGVVLETGPGVTQVHKGDHVVLHWRKGAGIHASGPKYKWDGRIVNAGWVTTFNTRGDRLGESPDADSQGYSIWTLPP